jgi:hypothetical protein
VESKGQVSLRRRSKVIAFLCGIIVGASVMAIVYEILIAISDPDELWCGCDGEGMAHLMGSEGCRCGVESEKGINNGQQ